MSAKKIRITLTYSSFRILLDLIGYYIKHHSNLEVLVLMHLKPKLWAKAMDEKDKIMDLEYYKAYTIKEVLRYIPDGLPIAEKNELRQLLFLLDERLKSELATI